MTKQSFVNIQSYKIEKWEKINDDLWLAETTCQEDGDRVGQLCCHFIGFLDGKPYVMIGPQNVPEELSKGRDLSVYKKYQNDKVPFDAIIFPIN